MPSRDAPDFHALSDKGRVRTTNEDQFVVAELGKSMLVHQTSLPMEDRTRLSGRRPGYLFLVADGLGGAPAGDRASSLAVDSVVRSVIGTMPWFFQLEDREDDLADELKKVLEKCQIKIEADVAENPSRTGMGTTLTMAYVIWPRLYVVHVGDARCYLLRGSTLERLTTDHTVISPPLQPGIDKPSPRKTLWNVIGGKEHEIWPDVTKASLEPGDVLLVATDGLPRELPDEKIAAALRATSTAAEGCRVLVDAANLAGGRDNITVVVVRFAGPEAGDRPSLEARASAAAPDPAIAVESPAARTKE